MEVGHSHNADKDMPGGWFMSQDDFNHYAKKHSPDAVVDKLVADALRKRALRGTISCALAFEVAGHLQKEPGVIGRTADLIELRLVKCQLGLFGHGPKKDAAAPQQPVPSQIEEAIRKALKDGRLPCKSAWEIAEAFALHKMRMGTICDSLGIKISPCQLGAF